MSQTVGGQPAMSVQNKKTKEHAPVVETVDIYGSNNYLRANPAKYFK